MLAINNVRAEQPASLEALDSGHWIYPLVRQGIVAGPIRNATTANRYTTATALPEVVSGGLAVKFTGSGGYVTAPTVADASPWTMLCFGVARSLASSAVVTVAEAPGSATVDRSVFVGASGAVSAYIYDGANKVATTTSAVVPGEPTLIAAVATGSAVQAYVAGELASTAASNAGFAAYTSPELVMGYGFMLGSTQASFWSGLYTLLLRRALTLRELVELDSNPWQIFEPSRIWVPVSAGGAASHPSTGELAADAATVAGTAAHYALHASSGALSAQDATIAGAAAHLALHTSSGSLVADAATVAGSAALSSAGAFSATGALSSDAATLSGTAVHYTLHAATGVIAADAAIVAGSAQHLTLHAATGALVADAASVSGVAVHTGDGAVIEVPRVGAGKSRRKSQRYVLAIDGKDVIVSDYSEAQALIDRAKEEAEAKADEALQRANASQRRPIGKVIRDARKALKAPSIEAPLELEDYARKVIADIQATYDQRLRDIEITALMRQRERQQEEDDEEVLMLIA